MTKFLINNSFFDYPEPKTENCLFLQNHQSPIWNGKVVPVVHLLDFFWRWFQFYCLLIVTREWSFNFCKMKNRRSSIIVLKKDSPKNNPIKNRWCEVFWQQTTTAVCVIVYNKFFTLINLNVHSFEVLLFTGNKKQNLSSHYLNYTNYIYYM